MDSKSPSSNMSVLSSIILGCFSSESDSEFLSFALGSIKKYNGKCGNYSLEHCCPRRIVGEVNFKDDKLQSIICNKHFGSYISTRTIEFFDDYYWVKNFFNNKKMGNFHKVNYENVILVKEFWIENLLEYKKIDNNVSSSYLNNKKNGIEEEFFEGTKKIRKISEYVDDKLEGETRMYYPNGMIQSVTNYKGDVVRSQRIYGDNGVLMFECHFNDLGMKIGTWKVYNSDGHLLSIENWKDGKKHGWFMHANQLQSDILYTLYENDIDCGNKWMKNPFVKNKKQINGE